MTCGPTLIVEYLEMYLNSELYNGSILNSGTILEALHTALMTKNCDMHNPKDLMNVWNWPGFLHGEQILGRNCIIGVHFYSEQLQTETVSHLVSYFH